MKQVRSHAATAVIGIFSVQLVNDLFRVLTGGTRQMWIDPSLFVVLLFLASLSVSGLLIGVIALVALWWRGWAVRQRLSHRRVKRPYAPTRIEIVGKDGRPL